MDIHCQHCNEPWDRAELTVSTRPCDYEEWMDHYRVRCLGDGVVLAGYRLTDSADDGDTSIVGGHELSSESCDECGGRGSDPCKLCDGNGYKVAPEWNVSEDISITEDNECVPCKGYGKINCNYCNGNGYTEETCGNCHEVIDEAGSYHRDDILVVRHGEFICRSCAIDGKLISDEYPCPECEGKGEVESETAIGTSADVARFRAGKGCPACDWGDKVLTKCEACHVLFYGYPGEPCGAYQGSGLEKCGGNLVAHESAAHNERLEKNRVLHELSGNDLDGLAADTDTFLKD